MNPNNDSPIKIGIILVLVATFTTSCMPPLEWVIPPVLFLGLLFGILLLGVILISSGSRKPVFRAEGVYLCAIALLYLAGYFVPILLLTLRRGETGSAYVDSLAIAIMSAVIIAGGVWLFRQYDPAFLKPAYAALFGFLLFFLINFGYYIATSQFAKYDYGGAKISGLDTVVTMDRVLQHLPYVSFVLAPVGVALAWFVDSQFRKSSWSADKLVRINLWVLWAVQVTLILIVVVIRAGRITDPWVGGQLMDQDTLDPAQLKESYLVLSDFRADLFFVSCHDLLVVVALTVGVIAMTAKERLNHFRNKIALAGVVVAVILAFLPFYVGQKSALSSFVGSTGTYSEREAKHNEFMNARGLYPNSTTLKHLLISLTAGGVLAFSFNLPGVKISLGK